MGRRLPWGWLLPLAGIAGFLVSVQAFRTLPRHDVDVEMQVALPLFVQVAMAGGDRNLAANFGMFRTFVVATERMTPSEYKVLASVQQDVSWLNSANEDNYYLAAAILAWNSEVDAAQTILARATKARPYDYKPAFYYGFNQIHFRSDPVGASAWVRDASEHLTDPDERLTMLNFAARWMDRSDDLDLAIQIVESMARQARRKDFRDYLLLRVDRLRTLASLRRAADAYRERFSHPPKSLDDLAVSGIISGVPTDPFGFGFDIGANGVPILLNAPRQR